MAIADAIEKLDSTSCQFAVDIGDDLGGFFPTDMARGEVVHQRCAVGPRLQRDQIHSKYDVIGPERYSLARRLDWGASGMIKRRVIAQHRHRADVTAGRHPAGDSSNQAEAPA